MTFLELAKEIDNATAIVATSEMEVGTAIASYNELVAKHVAEQTDATTVVSSAKDKLKAKQGKLDSLIHELKTLMGVNSEPKPQPTTSELKQLFMDGQKLRGK